MKHWKIKKCLCLLILPALVWTRIPVSFLTQNLSDYNNNCISLPRAQAKKADRFDVGICGKVFYIIQCNDNNEKIKHLSQITRKFPKHILNFDDWYSPLFTKLFYYGWIQNPVKRLVWHSTSTFPELMEMKVFPLLINMCYKITACLMIGIVIILTMLI